MSILQNIKIASLVARKAHDIEKAASLVTLLSEATMIGKNDGNRETTDVETITVIKKFIKNIDETLSLKTFAHDDPIAVKLTNERFILKSFLPTQFKDHEIKEELTNINQSTPGLKMGDLLKIFKSKFDGRYDGGSAAKIAKDVIAGI